jgi:hypothetical protein
MMYRCIWAYTTDPELKLLMKKLSSDEARHYSYFRRIFERHEATEKNSFVRKLRTISERSELVRDEDIAVAFRPLNEGWRGEIPFVPFTYAEFLATAEIVMKHYFPFEATTRMLFRPLREHSATGAVALNFSGWMLRKQFFARGLTRRFRPIAENSAG